MRVQRALVVLLCLTVSLAIVLAACAPAKPTAAPTAAAPAGKKVNVALLMAGSISDGGWNTLGYRGLEQLKSEGFGTAYTENMSQADIQAVVRGYIKDGYNLIVGHGGQFVTAFLQMAPEFPDVAFFVVANAPQGEKIAPNLQFYFANNHYAGYMAAVAASLVSKSHVVGFVGGADNPAQRALGNSFVQGATETVAGTKGLRVITGDYNDAARGREAALAMIGNGADVIYHAADVTGLGAIAAAIESKKLVIGMYSDQTSIWYANFITSIYQDLGWLIVTTAHAVRDGTFKGGQVWLPSFDNVYKFAAGQNRFNPTHVPPEMEKKIDEILGKLKSGAINVPYNINPS